MVPIVAQPNPAWDQTGLAIWDSFYNNLVQSISALLKIPVGSTWDLDGPQWATMSMG